MSRYEFRDKKTRRELAVELLIAYRVWIVLGVVALLAIAWFVRPEIPEVEIARAHKVAAIAALIAGSVGAIPASKILSWLYDPPRRFLVVPAMKESADPGIWEMSPAAWDQVHVVDGELYRWDGMQYPTYEAEAFDEETMTAEGTWRGSKPDSELLKHEKRVEKLRSEIEKDADMTMDLELSISSRVRQAVKAIAQSMIEAHASATIYDGDRVADVLSDLREDVDEDTGNPTLSKNGEKPIRDEDRRAAMKGLEDVIEEVDPDGK